MRFEVLVVAALMAVAAAGADFPRKQLAGPPEEFPEHELPDPLLGGVVSETGNFWVSLTESAAGVLGWKSTAPVDNTEFLVILFAQDIDSLTLTVQDAAGNTVPLPAAAPAAYPIGDSVDFDNGVMYAFSGLTAGVYTLTLTAAAGRVPAPAGEFDAFLAVDAESNDLLLTHLASYAGLLEGQTVGLRGRMFDQTAAGRFVRGQAAPAALRDVVTSAVLEAQFPDGHWEYAAMHDDGLHDDGAAGDGEFGGSFTAGPAGDYIVQATFNGTNAQGSFVRTSEHLVRVAPRLATLAGTASAALRLLAGRLDLQLHLDPATLTPEGAAATYRAYAQVWATTVAGGASVPVAWLSALVDVQGADGARPFVVLELDLAWLERAAAVAPLTLRGVQLAEVNSLVPQSLVARIDVKLREEEEEAAAVEDKKRVVGMQKSRAPPTLAAALARRRATGVALARGGAITEVMREGIPPAHIAAARARYQAAAAAGTNGGSNATVAAAGARLVMIHGYCSTGNPWLNTKDLWPADTVYFSDLKQSRTHDDFARRVLAFAEQQGVTECGFIGHSQGGIVGAHILNSYFSCADANARPGRKHTSLGSPYLGCSASGGTANLAKIMGGCGSNYDMTVDGASQWAATVAAANWAKVHYYTTTYKSDHCQLLMQSFLKKPNDGVTELVYAQPAAGNNHGNTYNECHVPNMNYPASFLNRNRNAEILAAMAL